MKCKTAVAALFIQSARVSERCSLRLCVGKRILCFTPLPLLTFVSVETSASPRRRTAPRRWTTSGSGRSHRFQERRQSGGKEIKRTAMITAAAANARSSSPVHRLISEALNAPSTQQCTRLPRSRIHPSPPLRGGGAEQKKKRKKSSSSTPKHTERLTQPGADVVN